MDARPEEIAHRLIAAALHAADPAAALRRAWPSAPDLPERVRLLAVGKAALAMGACGIDLLGARLDEALIVAPAPLVEGVPPRTRTMLLGADHPLPTARNVEAARRVEAFVRSTPDEAGVLFLLSGGGSAYLASPAEGLTLEDLRAATQALLRGGATIDELNAVRKHCERLKGGRLAALCAPRPMVTLVVSDVVGDPLDVIASGPTAPDPSTFADAVSALERSDGARLAPAVLAHLRAGVRGEHPETPKPGARVLEHASIRVIASNADACAAAGHAAGALGLPVIERTQGVRGEAGDVGRALARRVLASGVPGVVVLGGETTVRVGDATGLGGRNQELALAAAEVLAGHAGVAVASFGTDGIDGPTDAAGAIVTGRTWSGIVEAGIDPGESLRRHDSHRALAAAGALLRTGPTGTNVCDVMLGIFTRRG